MTVFTAYDQEQIIDYLRAQVPDGEVATDAKTLQSTSFSPNLTDADSGIALAFVAAKSTADIQGVLATARKFHVPVITQNQFTSTVIGADGLNGAIILSTKKMNQIVEISKADSLAIVQPGVINGDLDAAARKQGMFYAPNPGSKKSPALVVTWPLMPAE
jgi:FAD/FMN-containing dehydrogenases